MKKKILVGYDGSNETKDALKLAKNHAKAFGAKIEVVKSVTRHIPLDYEVIQVAEEDLKREIRNQLNEDITNYQTRLLVSSNSTGQNLVQMAELEKSDEIIIGDRKRSKVGKLLLGSTAQYVVLHAPCPVVTIKQIRGYSPGEELIQFAKDNKVSEISFVKNEGGDK